MSCVSVFLLTHKQSLPNYIRDGLFAVIVLGFIGIKLVFFLQGIDVLSYPEKHICYVLFGGLVDDVQIWIETRFASDDDEREARLSQK